MLPRSAIPHSRSHFTVWHSPAEGWWEGSSHRDGEGWRTHTRVLEYHFRQCHKDKYRLHLHLIYSPLTTTGTRFTVASFTLHPIAFQTCSFKWVLNRTLFNAINYAFQQQGGAQTPLFLRLNLLFAPEVGMCHVVYIDICRSWLACIYIWSNIWPVL